MKTPRACLIFDVAHMFVFTCFIYDITHMFVDYNACYVPSFSMFLFYTEDIDIPLAGVSDLVRKCVGLTPNRTNPGIFHIRFPKSDLKKSHICPILGQFDPPWGQIWSPSWYMGREEAGQWSVQEIK